MTQPQPAPGPASGEFFAGWMRKYQDAEEDYRLPLRRLPEARDELATAKDILDRIKAEIVMNGGTTAYPIDGKNEAQRAAQLLVACEGTPAFLDARDRVREKENLLQKLSGEMQENEHAMRAARLALEYATGWLYHKAAVEGGKHAREQ